MKQKKWVSIILAIMLLTCMPITTYANSSWHWLTKTNPFDVLPYAVILTLLIEYVTIKRANSITRSLRLFIVICLANVASFLLPYAILLMPSDVGYTFEMSIRNLPRYIVGSGYLFLTLIAEVPVVYISLKKFITNKKRFLMTIIIVNAVTTIMVAIIERVICKGSW